MEILPDPRTDLARSVLTTLATRPATMADALRHLRVHRRYRRLPVGGFFWEVDRLVDAGYLLLPPSSRGSDSALSLTRPAGPPPVVAGPVAATRARVRAGHLRAGLHTATFRVDVEVSFTESDRGTGGES